MSNSELEIEFFKAIKSGKLDLINKALNKGANIDWLHSSGKTSLAISILNGDDEVVELLLNKGCDPNIYVKESLHPLILSIRANMSFNIIEKIIEKSTDE